MIDITRASLEGYVAAMVAKANGANNRPLKILTSPIQAVIQTPQGKARIEKMHTEAKAAENEYQLFIQGKLEYKPNVNTSNDTYTKFGKMTLEERSTWVQNKLDEFSKAENFHQQWRLKYPLNQASTDNSTQTRQINTAA